MPLKLTLALVCTIFCINSSLFAQCIISPQTAIIGSRCVGSELSINSNVLPESVSWVYNGSPVSSQTVSLSQNATTVAGGNGAGSGMNQLNNPDRLYVDPAGVLYIPDLTNNRVQKWLPGATSGITVAGGNGTGNAANQFNRPTSVFVDQHGNIYVTDQNNKRVQKWAPGATTGITVAGLNNELTYPTDVFVDSNGNLYVSDQFSNVVRKYPAGSQTSTVVAGDGSYGVSPVQLISPTGIFVDAAGTLYVCDTDNGRVQKFASGSLSGITVASGFTPLDVSVDCNGNVFIVDYFNSRIVKYPAGAPSGVTVAGGNGSGTAANQLNTPIGVFIVGNNSLYVADYGNHRVQRFSTSIDPRFTAGLPGIYTITVNYSCCPSYTENVEILDQQQPLISIETIKTSVCPGESVSVSAVNSNAILDPVYKWKLNGLDVGTNSPTYLSTSLQNNDKLYCILTSTKACTLPLEDTSNIIQMNVFVPLPLQLDDRKLICPGTDILLQVPAIYDSYIWQDNSTQSSFFVNAKGKYYVTVTDACHNSFSDTIIVDFYKTAENFLQRDTTICSYDKLLLTSATDFTSFLWNDGSTSPNIIVDQPGLYWMNGTDRNNCITSDSVVIKFETCPPKGLYFPNAFSPNRDGRNDIFKPAIYGTVSNYKFSIYNRYGERVFYSTNPSIGWNGTVRGQLPDSGVFVWICQYDSELQKKVVEKGTVVLIR